MNSSSRKILPAIKLATMAVLLFAASGFLFAQTEQPASQSPVPVVQAEAPAVQAAVPAKSFFDDAPAADREIIVKAEGLAGQGKWLSAWNALSEYDAVNANPFILAEKTRIALDGYAQTTLHLVFGFVDLAEGQDLESARAGATEIANPVEFNPGELAKAIEAKGDAIPPVLSMMVGDYFHTVWANYKGQWLKDDAEILGSGVENYERALAYDTYTAQSLNRQSEMLIALQRYDGAEAVVKKALELDPENNALTLRLAEVYFSTARYAEVYPLADKVIAASQDGSELNDGYIVAIKSGLAALDKEILAKYISGFEKSFPNEYMPGLVRHLVAVQLGDPAAADAAADAVVEAFPGNPDIIRSILSTWLSANDPDSGFRFLDRAIAKAPADEAMAALYFYKALLNGEVAQSAEVLVKALADLDTAESYFKKSYPEGHEVFGMMADLRTQWSDALKAAQAVQAPQSAAPTQDTVPAVTATPDAAAPAVAAPAVNTPAVTTPATEGEETTTDATSAATE